MAKVPAELADRFGTHFVHPTVLASDGDTVAGAVDFEVLRRGKDVILSLFQILVLPEYRGRGVAAGLFAEAHKWTRPSVVYYPYDTEDGKGLAASLQTKYPNVRWVIFDVDDVPDEVSADIAD